MSPRWRFARMTPAEINQDPVQGEFFSRETDLPGRVVREAIQNSLDAGRRNQQVRVRFVFSGERDVISVGHAAPYLKRLKKHVKAVVDAGGLRASPEDDEEQSAALDALACFGRPMTYLVIEDFGTKGLTGDPCANLEHERNNNFWGFFRAIGISPKGESDAGSWGLGKWVFPDASIINTYLGMTQRVGEDDWLLMGMSLLKTHHLGNTKYRYYGSFAAHDDRDDEAWFPMPVSSSDDPDFVLRTFADFKLEERMDRGTGLSVIVPYPRDELKPAAVARAVLTQYFLAIVRGALVVEIAHPEEGDRVIDADSIADEVKRIPESDRDDESAESLSGAIDLTRWALNEPAGRHITLPANRLGDALATHVDLDQLRDKYERGERLAFQLTTDVRRKTPRATKETHFRLYAERDEALGNGHDYFMRGPLRIPHMDHIERQKARVLVLVDDDSPLGHMLRDAEGPAHESWDPHAQRLKENWIGGPRRVKEVRQAAAHVLQRLLERPNERQMDALADLFPANSASAGGPATQRRVPAPTPPSAPTRSPLLIESPARAFVVRAAGQADGTELVNRTWHVRFAYDTVRGNPFTDFESGLRQGSPDFSLEVNQDLQLDHRNCRIDVTGANALQFTVLGEDFLLRISGFDDRDVKVEVRELHGGTDADEDVK